MHKTIFGYMAVGFISLMALGVGCKQAQPQLSNVKNTAVMNNANSSQVIPAEVTLIPGTDNTTWQVQLNSEAVGTLQAASEEEGISAVLFKQTDAAAYLGVTPVGLGGYILYAGPQRLYRLDLATKEMKEIIGTSQANSSDGFISDISPDEQWVAYVNQADEIITIDLLSLTGGTIHQVMVPSAYQQAGDAVFSPDGNQLAYAAAVGSPDNESGVVFTVQLGTDSQKQIDQVNDNYFQIEGWVDNTTVDYHVAPQAVNPINVNSTNTNTTNTNTTVTTPETKTFTVTTEQFDFSPATITVKKGTNVVLNLTSTDTTHGFALPAFNVSTTIKPGATSTVKFTADKTGTFSFSCNVVCGSGHSQMTGQLVVQ